MADLSPRDQVRLLVNDRPAIGDDPNRVFTDDEIDAFLTLEGDVVKRAAAQALDTIADDEALTSKVIRTQDLATDGAKVADSLRKRAAALREQADVDDEGFFEIVPVNPTCVPDLTDGWPR